MQGTQPTGTENPREGTAQRGLPATPSPNGIIARLRRFALAGAGAAFLLNAIELVDLNIRLTPVFDGLGERLTFLTYFILPVAVGAIIGLVSGVLVYISFFLASKIEKALGSRRTPGFVVRSIIWIAISAALALLLYQQPKIYAYGKGLIRELEKVDFLTGILLNHERASTGLILAGLTFGCLLTALITFWSGRTGRFIKAVWLGGLILVLAAAYYVDTRVEPGLYEHSLHDSMFLLSLVVAMALLGSLYLASVRLRTGWPRLGKSTRRILSVAIGAAMIAAIYFTFINIDKNQNLKTQLFYRSAVARQYFELVQWAIDFDRDGYSAYLGGGDCDDRNNKINPGAKESVADGVDNNCIGGDLTERDRVEWAEGRTKPQSTATAQRLNVIYIFIDALRADRLGVYGYPRSTSPNIDKLASRASVFENAFTPAPNTFEAFPKFMQCSHWDGHYETWSEALARGGYNNLLFPRRIATQLRYVKGMKVVARARVKKLDETIDAAIEVLGSAPNEQPFCAFLYATDPHRPYLPHPEFDFGPALADKYDVEVAFADQQFGRLFDWMEQTGRMNDTMIVMMADHGESLGERGFYKHSSQLYNEQARIPIIIYVPGLAPRRIKDYVSSIDLGATILNAAGVEASKDYAGVSLLPVMRGEPFTHLPVYAEQTYNEDSPFVSPGQNLHADSKKYMVITQEGFKLIYNRNHHTFELFDLNTDPNELRNLFDRMPERASNMKAMLGRFIDIVIVSRPWDADESQYGVVMGKTDEE
jgi:arylsulfatase A-like enzyme